MRIKSLDQLPMWDEDALVEQAQNDHADRLDQLTDQDFARAQAAVERVIADRRRGFRRCPRKACRRARRCCNTEAQCAVPRRVTSRGHRRDQELIDTVYADIQQRRRDAALAAESDETECDEAESEQESGDEDSGEEESTEPC